MKNVKPCKAKSHAQLITEWDRLALERHRQITSGEDLSFDHVLVPTIFRLLEYADVNCVLDIGSGTGNLTLKLAQYAEKVVAVEPSTASIAIAQDLCEVNSRVEFVGAPFEEAVDRLGDHQPTAAVAAMTLMCTPDLTAFALALGKTLQTGHTFAALLCHPWFWPRYWEYDREPWFSYNHEIFVEAPFSISKRRTEIITTHIHRPLEQYVQTFERAGFALRSLVEPMPSSEVQALYPRPWQFPRFLGARWVKS